jgi:FMN phosphatase YigB (HAD superfamily)
VNCDAVVFDVGGTLLHVTDDPQARALQRIAALGPVSVEAFRTGVRDAVADWRRAGGEASHEDLPETWMRHYERGLTAARFSGDCAAAARILEEAFLVDGWEVFADAVPTLDRLFRIAVKRLGCNPARVLYVGDSVEHDVLGATGVGMQAALLDREGTYNGNSATISSLAALATQLER